MNSLKGLILTFVAAVSVYIPASTAVLGDEPSCIVIPSRQAVVKFAFDVTKLRKSIYLIAYDRDVENGSTVLYIWNDKEAEWKKIGVEQYVSGEGVFASKPKQVILLGADKDLPSEISGVTDWGSDVFRIKSLDVVSMMNDFNSVYKFNSREWKWLANRYNIEYKDLNEKRRRYGRYGESGDTRIEAQNNADKAATDMDKITGKEEIIIVNEKIEDKPVITPVAVDVKKDEKKADPKAVKINPEDK